MRERCPRLRAGELLGFLALGASGAQMRQDGPSLAKGSPLLAPPLGWLHPLSDGSAGHPDEEGIWGCVT